MENLFKDVSTSPKTLLPELQSLKKQKTSQQIPRKLHEEPLPKKAKLSERSTSVIRLEDESEQENSSCCLPELALFAITAKVKIEDFFKKTFHCEDQDNAGALIEAIKANDLDLIKALLSVDANVNRRVDEELPLALAVRNGRSDIVELLVQKNHSPINFGYGLSLAIETNQKVCIDLINQSWWNHDRGRYRVEYFQDLLHHFIVEGDRDQVNLLLSLSKSTHALRIEHFKEVVSRWVEHKVSLEIEFIEFFFIAMNKVLWLHEREDFIQYFLEEIIKKGTTFEEKYATCLMDFFIKQHDDYMRLKDVKFTSERKCRFLKSIFVMAILHNHQSIKNYFTRECRFFIKGALQKIARESLNEDQLAGLGIFLKELKKMDLTNVDGSFPYNWSKTALKRAYENTSKNSNEMWALFCDSPLYSEWLDGREYPRVRETRNDSEGVQLLLPSWVGVPPYYRKS